MIYIYIYPVSFALSFECMRYSRAIVGQYHSTEFCGRMDYSGRLWFCRTYPVHPADDPPSPVQRSTAVTQTDYVEETSDETRHPSEVIYPEEEIARSSRTPQPQSTRGRPTVIHGLHTPRPDPDVPVSSQPQALLFSKLSPKKSTATPVETTARNSEVSLKFEPKHVVKSGQSVSSSTSTEAQYRSSRRSSQSKPPSRIRVSPISTSYPIEIDDDLADDLTPLPSTSAGTTGSRKQSTISQKNTNNNADSRTPTELIKKLSAQDLVTILPDMQLDRLSQNSNPA